MDKEKILRELQFRAVRSSGPGGQHVNKVASKVQLSFDIENSLGLNDFEKNRLRFTLGHNISKDDWLKLSSESSRSQHKNKELVTQRFFQLIKKALKVPKKRKPTKPSKNSIEKRLNAKKKLSDKKANRKKPDFN